MSSPTNLLKTLKKITYEMAEPDPLRLAYRDVIKQTIREVVIRAGEEPIDVVRSELAAHAPEADRENVASLIIEELRRLHEGVLARYGLRLSEFSTWRARRGSGQV